MGADGLAPAWYAYPAWETYQSILFVNISVIIY
jgi:hypothetical protein